MKSEIHELRHSCGKCGIVDRNFPSLLQTKLIRTWEERLKAKTPLSFYRSVCNFMYCVYSKFLILLIYLYTIIFLAAFSSLKLNIENFACQFHFRKLVHSEIVNIKFVERLTFWMLDIETVKIFWNQNIPLLLYNIL